MEKAKRAIKLFFVQYGRSLFILAFIAFLIIYLIQYFNQIEKDRSDILETNNPNYASTVELNMKKKQLEKIINQDSKIIDEFINYCKHKKTEEAYSMLTIHCKNTKYKTIEEFDKNYMNSTFVNTFDYKIEPQEIESIYKIKVYTEDILHTGNINNRKYIEFYYAIIEDSNGNKKIELDYIY